MAFDTCEKLGSLCHRPGGEFKGGAVAAWGGENLMPILSRRIHR